MPTIIVCKKCGKEKVHHGKGLCDPCYQEAYRDTHKAEIQEYQEDYRKGPAYAEQNRAYVAKYRRRD